MGPISATVGPGDVLAFWRAAGPAKWFTKDATFDEAIRARFFPTYQAAAARQFGAWEATPEGACALVIVLDQFPRNMFRDSARTFAADPVAREVTTRALARGFDLQVPASERPFFYLPFMHSEELADQERSLTLYQALGAAENTTYALNHLDIIRRFGRFPHRNKMLGRATTPEEQAFLDAGGFAG